jgi:2-polyprenyl-6-methoxyphenol hydroxylase-like FAD-dependent oxidoreductase
MAVLEHGIVMGGGVAGLLAAAGLAPHSERVTIVDRDPLPVDGPEALGARRGVPQGGIVHRLLALGEASIEELLPGLREELLAAGAEKRAPREDAPGHDRGVDEPGTLWLTRPLLEGVLRRRVLALPGVEVVQGAVGGLLATADGRAVTGVTLRGAESDELTGDLVVDASGRSSRAATWVEGLGGTRPRTLGTRVHVAYACQRLRLREGALPAGTEALTVPPSGRSPFTIDLEPCGSGEHVLSVAGTARHQPPADFDGLLDLVALLPERELADALDSALAGAEPVGETISAKAAGAHRQLWEALEDGPEGLVHVGDAAAMFTPLYGQGMAMAAVGAVVLRDALGAADGTGAADGADAAAAADGAPGVPAGFAAGFQRRLGGRLDPAWESTTSQDAQIPGAEMLLDGQAVEELPTPGALISEP